MEQQIKPTTEVDIDDLWERHLERAANHFLSDEDIEEMHRQWEQEELAMRDYWERRVKEEVELAIDHGWEPTGMPEW